MTSGEPDFQARMNALVDIWKIKGLVVKDPYIPLAIPISVENPALAYDAVNDRFYVDLAACSLGSLPISLADSWTRILGEIDLARTLGAAISHTNPLLVRLSNGTTWIDPRDRNWTITESLARSWLLTASDVVSAVQSGAWSTGRTWNLGASDVPDLSDRAARLLGVAYGSLDKLQQQATTKELFVQISHAGVAKDPTAIRALTTSDKITPEQATRASLKVQPEREDIISLGGVASPNAAGVQIVAPSGSLKPKVYDCEYEVLAAGLHYFYFGTTTAATTKRFLTRQTIGVNSKSFVQPRVGEAGDGIYLYSAVSETNMPYDIGYALE